MQNASPPLCRLAAWLLAGWLLLTLAGCAATGGLALHNVGALDPAQPGSYVNASAAQVQGGLRIHRSGQPLVVDVGMPLATGDVVDTLAGTVAVIRFPDGHEAVLLPGTRVQLGSLIADFGEFFVRVFKQTQGQFKVKTKYVTAGVEGTSFWVRVGHDNSLAVGVLDGSIRLSSATNSWQPVPVLADEVATVQRDQPPTKTQQTRDQVDSIVRLMRNGLRLAPRPPPPVRLPNAPMAR